MRIHPLSYVFGDLTAKWKIYQRNPKSHILRGKTSYDVQIVKIGPLVRPVRVTKRQKPCSGKLGIHSDHPRRRIEITFCVGVVFGDSSEVQVSSKSVKCMVDVEVEICHFPLLIQ